MKNELGLGMLGYYTRKGLARNYPGNNPEERIQHLAHGESLKSGIIFKSFSRSLVQTSCSWLSPKFRKVTDSCK